MGFLVGVQTIPIIQLLLLTTTAQFSEVPCERQDVDSCVEQMLQQQGLLPTDRSSCTVAGIRCRYYQFVKDCVSRAGQCGIEVIAETLKRKLEQSTSAGASVGCMMENGMKALPPNLNVYIALWGHLQQRCDRTKCGGAMIGKCEAQIRQKNAKQPSEYDLHRHLMRQLNASSNLMLSFPRENRDEQCAVTTATLNSLFRLQYKFCFHHRVTQCVCKLHRLQRQCGIQCSDYLHRNAADTPSVFTRRWVMQLVSGGSTSSARGWWLASAFRSRFEHISVLILAQTIAFLLLR